MTNDRLAELISDIEKAIDGASLREALKNAIKALNEDGGNALTFGGQQPSYFAHLDEFNYLLNDMMLVLEKFDENPTITHNNLVQSGNTYNYIMSLLNRLNVINGKTTKRDTIADALTALSKTKRLIKEAIVYQHGTAEDSDTFEGLADRIKALPIWNDVGEKTITKNGEERAESGQGWNVVHVAIEPKVEPMLINTLGEHTVPEGVDAWDPVTIQVPGLKNKSSASGGSGGSYSGGGSSEYIKEYAHLDIKANGTYTASEQQKEAIGSVDVQVNGIDPAALALMKFTVKFEDENHELLEEIPNVKGGTNVVYGQTYYDKGKTPPKLKKTSEDGTIYTFSHWNPPPYYIDHDMTCTAQYEKGIISFGEPQYEWSDILTGSGELGDIKILNLLPYTGPAYWHGGTTSSDTLYFGSIRMRCVSKDEAWTTWVSEDLIRLTGNNSITSVNGFNNKRTSLTPINGYYVSEKGPEQGTEISSSSDPAYAAASKLGWANSPLRVWLNTDFLNNCIPPAIRQRIVGVPKTFHNIYGYDPEDHTVTDAVEAAGAYLPSVYGEGSVHDGTCTLTESACKIWIPSVREFWGSYSKQFPDVDYNVDGQHTSDNRVFCVENRGFYYLTNGEYIEPDGINWANATSRKDALRQVFLDKTSEEGSAMSGATIKQIGYVPYNEFIATDRPYCDNSTNSFSWKVASWPTRTFYNGDSMIFTELGNPKADQSKAANEQIDDPAKVNLAQFNSYSGMEKGLCFGFCIGKA